MILKNILITFLVALSVVSCSDQPSDSHSDTAIKRTQSINVAENSTQLQTDTQSDEHQVTGFQPDYISAVDLNQRYKDSNTPMVFDVRSKASFAQSHIQFALHVPYGKTSEDDLSQINGLRKDSEIVTYCGCPRHLSSLAAKHLTDLGYSNVKVLYDGFWVWRDSGYPTVTAQQSADTTELRFRGQLAGETKQVANTDLFVRHTKTGQLEAARTNIKGEFEFEFHLYDYESSDHFEFIVADLNNPSIAKQRYSDQSAMNIQIVL